MPKLIVNTPEKLQQARNMLGLSQAAMAEKLGIGRIILNRMENDNAPISLRHDLAMRYLLNEAGLRVIP